MPEGVAAPGLRRLPPYWFEYTTRAKTRWYNRQILEVFTTEFRDRTKEYYVGVWTHAPDLGDLQRCVCVKIVALPNAGLCTVNGHPVTPTYRIQNSDLLV